MKMKTKHMILKTVMTGIIGLLLVMPGEDVNAGIQLTQDLTVGGFLRYEFGIHTAESNPNLPENHDLSLSRFFLYTEWRYRVTDKLKVQSTIRFLGDTAYHWDSDLVDHNAFPIDVPEYDWTMMKASEDDFRAEVWELYADVDLGNLWLRLGKQQIAWGEMIGGRIMDAINPLDISWNLFFEPEEFEIIRIPNWAIRGVYSFTGSWVPNWLIDPNIEAFVNPGDVLPNQVAEYGAPFLPGGPFPPFMRVTETDNRGDAEWGVRVGGRIGNFYGTLNYLHLYSDDFNLSLQGFVRDPVNGMPFLFPPDPRRYSMLIDLDYKSMDMYGTTLNYAFDQPWNLVITFEGVYILDQPYQAAATGGLTIREQDTWKSSIAFDRNTSVFPPTLWHASFMMLHLQFDQFYVTGDEDKILDVTGAKIDKDWHHVVFQAQQPFLWNQLTFTYQMIYDFDDCYLIKPSVKRTIGDHWYFDVFATFLGGSEDRQHRTFGYFGWADTVYGRITYQF